MSLTTDQIDICNAALLRIGSKKLSESDTSSLEYQLADTFYPIALNEVLASHTWACASKQSIVVSDGIDVLGRYSYPMPSGALRLIEINFKNEVDVKYELLGTKIYTDETTSVSDWVKDTAYPETMLVKYNDIYYRCLDYHVSVVDETPDIMTDLWEVASSGVCVYVKYVGDITPSEFSPMFMSCIIPLLSSHMATALSTSQQKSITLTNEYKERLAFARYTDATQKRNVYGVSTWFGKR